MALDGDLATLQNAVNVRSPWCAMRSRANSVNAKGNGPFGPKTPKCRE